MLLLVSMAGLTGWTLGQQWLSTDPGGRVEFVPHTRIAVPYFLLSGVLGLVLPVLAFMLGWAFLSRASGYVTVAVLCAMLGAHLARTSRPAAAS